MASPPRTPEREEERRLNLRTLVIASAASATAAAVTSQLWIAGTWIAAALTPVMVALVSEILHRPTEKIAHAWSAERQPGALRTREGPPLSQESRERGEQPLPPVRPSNGSDPPVRIYRQPSSRTPQQRGRIAIGVVAATAAIAFAITVVTITAGELIAGESIGKGDRRTTFVGGSGKKTDKDESTTTETREQTTPAQTETTPTTPADETAPDQTTEPTTSTPTPTPAPAPPTTTPQSETTPAP
jgi:hypothetical protein